MKLIRVEISGFGKLKNEKMEFSDGLNTLLRQNGWGKTTLAVFLKAMFYGLPATRVQSLDENERKKYAPWEGGIYGGSLEFSIERGEFRVERTFGARESEDTYGTFDLATNRPVDLKGDAGSLGEALFGIDADGFERSVYFGQRTLAPKEGYATIRNRLVGALENVDDIDSFDSANEVLQKEKRLYQTPRGGSIFAAEQNIKSLKIELDRCKEAKRMVTEHQRELRNLRGEAEKIAAEKKKLRALLDRKLAQGQIEELRKQKNEKKNRVLRLTGERNEALAFFEGKIPTEEEHRAMIRDCNSMRESAALGGENQKKLAEVEKKRKELLAGCGGRMPREEEFAALEGDNDRLRSEVGKRNLFRDELARRKSGVFEGTLPDRAELDRVSGILRTAKAAGAERERLTAREASLRGARTGGRIWFWFGFLIALAGVFALLQWCGMLTLSLPDPLTPYLLIAGIAAGGIGILMILFSLVGGKEQRRAAILKGEIKKQEGVEREAIRTVRSFLQQYAFDGEDPEEGLNRLGMTLAKNERQTAEAEAVTHQLREAEEAIARLSAKLSGFFRKTVGFVTNEEDFTVQIRSYRQAYDRVCDADREIRDLNAAAALYAGQIENIRSRLTPYLGQYGFGQDVREEDALRAISEKLTDVKRLESGIAEAQKDYRDFVSAQDPDLIGADPIEESVETLREKEEAFDRSLKELKTRENAEIQAIGTCTDDADRTLEVEEEIGSLSDQVGRDREKVRLLDETVRLLTEAKEALSCRYLAGMQERFRHYAALLSENLPDGVLNGDFEVLTRESGLSRPEASQSRGTRDAMRFCIRLALADTLFSTGERPFLLLDDPLVNLDDERLASAKELLQTLSREYQILSLVCSDSRA